MHYLLHHPYLRSSLGCATTVNFFNLISLALLVLFASRNLELSAGTIGLAFGIGASGGLLGALAASPLTRIFGAGRLIAVSSIVFPVDRSRRSRTARPGPAPPRSPRPSSSGRSR